MGVDNVYNDLVGSCVVMLQMLLMPLLRGLCAGCTRHGRQTHSWLCLTWGVSVGDESHTVNWAL